MDILAKILERNNITPNKVEDLSPLVMAYIGDSIYEIFIRAYLVGQGIGKVGLLHKNSINFVKAKAQADIVRNIENYLNEDEQDIVRRGRNIKPASPPKNADIMDYRYATGFEALVGYLYMTGKSERLFEILEKAISK